MAIDGHNLKIKVDTSQFNMLAKATEKAIGESMQESIDNMVFGMVDMSKKLSFNGMAIGTAKYGLASDADFGDADIGPDPQAGPFPLDMSLITTEQARELAREVVKKYIPKPRASLVEVDND